MFPPIGFRIGFIGTTGAIVERYKCTGMFTHHCRFPMGLSSSLSPLFSAKFPFLFNLFPPSFFYLYISLRRKWRRTTRTPGQSGYRMRSNATVTRHGADSALPVKERQFLHLERLYENFIPSGIHTNTIGNLQNFTSQSFPRNSRRIRLNMSSKLKAKIPWLGV